MTRKQNTRNKENSKNKIEFLNDYCHKNILLGDVTLCDTDKTCSKFCVETAGFTFLDLSVSVSVISSQRVLIPNKAFKGRLFSPVSLTNVACFEISGDTICGTSEVFYSHRVIIFCGYGRHLMGLITSPTIMEWVHLNKLKFCLLYPFLQSLTFLSFFNKKYIFVF